MLDNGMNVVIYSLYISGYTLILVNINITLSFMLLCTLSHIRSRSLIIKLLTAIHANIKTLSALKQLPNKFHYKKVIKRVKNLFNVKEFA